MSRLEIFRQNNNPEARTMNSNVNPNRLLRLLAEAIRDTEGDEYYDIVAGRINETARGFGMDGKFEYTPKTMFELVATLTGAMISTGDMGHILANAVPIIGEIVETDDIGERIKKATEIATVILNGMETQNRLNRLLLKLPAWDRKSRGRKALAELSGLGVFNHVVKPLEMVEASGRELKKQAETARKDRKKIADVAQKVIRSLRSKGKSGSRHTRSYMGALEKEKMTELRANKMLEALNDATNAVMNHKPLNREQTELTGGSFEALADNLGQQIDTQIAMGDVLKDLSASVTNFLSSANISRAHNTSVFREIGALVCASNHPLLLFLILQSTLDVLGKFFIAMQYDMILHFVKFNQEAAKADARKVLENIFANALETERKLKEEEEAARQKRRNVVEGKVLSDFSEKKK